MTAKDYRAGGARGEVEREISTEWQIAGAASSRRWTTGTIERLKTCGAIAVPAVEHNWQGCEPAGPEFMSAQKWNCAARKIIPSSRAQIRNLFGFTNMYLLRRSLGRNGCGVKEELGGTFRIQHLREAWTACPGVETTRLATLFRGEQRGGNRATNRLAGPCSLGPPSASVKRDQPGPTDSGGAAKASVVLWHHSARRLRSTASSPARIMGGAVLRSR